MGNAGFTAMCRYLPCERLEELCVINTNVTRIPAEFRRFKQLKEFYTGIVGWYESGFKGTGNGVKDAKRALEYAARLVSLRTKKRFEEI
jgi:hypothetical protein